MNDHYIAKDKSLKAYIDVHVRVLVYVGLKDVSLIIKLGKLIALTKKRFTFHEKFRFH